MDKATIDTIEAVLKCGDRVELIPTKDGVKIFRIKRKEEKQNNVPVSKR